MPQSEKRMKVSTSMEPVLPLGVKWLCWEYISEVELIGKLHVSRNWKALVTGHLATRSILHLSKQQISPFYLDIVLPLALNYCCQARIVDLSGQTRINENMVIQVIQRLDKTLEQLILPPQLPTCFRFIQTYPEIPLKVDGEEFYSDLEIVDADFEFPLWASPPSSSRTTTASRQPLGHIAGVYDDNLLHLAITSGSLVFVNHILSKQRFSLQQTDRYGRGCVTLAIVSVRPETLALLLNQYHANWTFEHFIEAFRTNNQETVQTLLRSKKRIEKITFCQWKQLLKWVISTTNPELLQDAIQFALREHLIQLNDVPQMHHDAQRRWKDIERVNTLCARRPVSR